MKDETIHKLADKFYKELKEYGFTAEETYKVTNLIRDKAFKKAKLQ